MASIKRSNSLKDLRNVRECKFREDCRRPGLSCKFGHARVTVGQTITPIGNDETVMCRYDTECKLPEGKCHFKHSGVTIGQSTTKATRMCKYGRNCRRKGDTCYFDHPLMTIGQLKLPRGFKLKE